MRRRLLASTTTRDLRAPYPAADVVRPTELNPTSRKEQLP
ncbi:hypothetical protein BH20ACT6_BH20ACT6_10210 [soil metagenome]